MGTRLARLARLERRDVGAWTVLVAAVTLFHLRGLLPGQTFLAVDLANSFGPWHVTPVAPLHNPLIADPVFQFYPFLVDSARAVQQGEYPLWNPDILLGQPSVADPLSQTFYPVPLALALVLGAARGYAINLWLHVVLAALLTYAYLRALACTRIASVFGAITYALSGYLVTWFEFPFWLTTLSWLPGVLWLYERALRTRHARDAVFAGLPLALAIFGGQFSFVATFLLFFGLYAAGAGLASQRRSGMIWALAVFGISTALALLLTAVQTLPFAEFLASSQRATSGDLADALPSRQLLTLLVPTLFGSPVAGAQYWGILNFNEAVIYAGLPALLLACLAPFRARRFRVYWLCALLLVVLYFVLGGPGVQWLGIVPLLKSTSLHRSAFIIPLIVAVLAAYTLSSRSGALLAALLIALGFGAVVAGAIALTVGDAGSHLAALWPALLQGCIALGACLAALAWGQKPGRTASAAAALVIIAWLDLYLIGGQYNPAGPIDGLMPATAGTRTLQEQLGSRRAAIYQIGDLLFGPNLLSLYGIPEAGGYSSLLPADYWQLFESGDPRQQAKGSSAWLRANDNVLVFSAPSRRLLDLLSIGFVLTPGQRIDTGVRTEVDHNACEGDSGEITSTHAVTGTFAVRENAINRLDLRLRVYAPTHRRLRVRMWQGPARQRLVLDAEQDTSELRDRDSVSIFFAPESDAPGHNYEWEATPAGSSEPTGVGLCTQSDGTPAFAVFGTDWLEIYHGEFRLYQRTYPIPRAYVVYAAEHVDDMAQSLTRVLDERFDLRTHVLSTDRIDLPSDTDLQATEAQVVSLGANYVRVRANAQQKGMLVLADQYYPGWHARVDGQPAEVVRVNYLERGVLLNPGAHEVLFEFMPASLQRGAILSALGLLFGLILIASGSYPSMRRRSLSATVAKRASEHSPR